MPQAHFAEFSEFSTALVRDGFYECGEPLRKAIATAHKLRLLSEAELVAMRALLERTEEAKASNQVWPLRSSSQPLLPSFLSLSLS